MIRVSDYDPDFSPSEAPAPLTKTYQVAYRVADRPTTSGSRQERYDDVTTRLREMPAATPDHDFADEAHVATSTWLVDSNEISASKLLRTLKGRLTPKFDILRVIEVVTANSSAL